MSNQRGRNLAEKQSTKDTFIKKIHICSMVYDYSDEEKDVKAKNERLESIQEIRDFASDIKAISALFLPNLELIFEMIEKNLFRPLFTTKKSSDKLSLTETGIEEEDVQVDPSWPHIQGIYEIFLKIIVNDGIDVKSLKNFITPYFIHNLIQLLNSEEVREREYLKTILHRLYAKLIQRRKIIRKSINERLLSMIYENIKFNGTNELLEILSSVISGFAVPLRDEHLDFFKNIIIPLHKVHYSYIFHEQLMRCSFLFVNKDPDLVNLLIEGILRYWPFGNSIKENSFLNELREILEFCDIKKIEDQLEKIFKRIAICLSSPNASFSGKTMQLFEQEIFLIIIKSYKTIVYPLLVPTIIHVSERYWHKTIQESANSLRMIMYEIDPVIFDNSANEKVMFSLEKMHNCAERAVSEDKWKMMLEEAKRIEPEFKEPTIPYTDTHVVGLNNLNNIKLSSNNLIPLV